MAKKKQSKGLGDDIEKITEATGIKKVVKFYLEKIADVMNVKRN